MPITKKTPASDSAARESEAPCAWELGECPVLATAIHDGHRFSKDLVSRSGLSEADRLREEDPYTGEWARRFCGYFVGHFSRFEFDLNRPRDRAVYRNAEDAWGLPVWKAPLPLSLLERSRGGYDRAYGELARFYQAARERFGTFVVLDLHSYNCRRNGPQEPPSPETTHPQINLGTESVHVERFQPVLTALACSLSDSLIGGRHPTIGENVIFKGGHHPRWANEWFFPHACVIAVEIRKFFMDEWTGVLDPRLHDDVGKALRKAVKPILQALKEVT